MGSSNLNRISLDLLAILPLIIRGTHRKLLKSKLSELEIAITPLHFEIINLVDKEGPLHAKIIGDRLQVSKAQMTQLLTRLEQMKLVQRNTDSQDRRANIISLTDKGRVMVKEFKETILNNLRETLAVLSAEELSIMTDSLKNLQQILQRLP